MPIKTLSYKIKAHNNTSNQSCHPEILSLPFNHYANQEPYFSNHGQYPWFVSSQTITIECNSTRNVPAILKQCLY